MVDGIEDVHVGKAHFGSGFGFENFGHGSGSGSGCALMSMLVQR